MIRYVEDVKLGWAIGFIGGLVGLVVAIIAVKLASPYCWCINGCADCQAAWARVRRNRRWSKRILFVVCLVVLALVLIEEFRGWQEVLRD